MKNQNNNENKKRTNNNRTGNTKNCGGCGKSRNCKGSTNEHKEEERLTHKTAVTAEERRASP